MEAIVNESGSLRSDHVSHTVYQSLVTEALRGAAFVEKDTRVRWGPFLREVDRLGETLLFALQGGAVRDERVVQILSFCGVECLKPVD